MFAAEVPSDQWIGALSGGSAVGALSITCLAYVWRRMNQALAKIDSIQDERLKDVREWAPMVRDMTDQLTRVTVMLERKLARIDGDR